MALRNDPNFTAGPTRNRLALSAHCLQRQLLTPMRFHLQGLEDLLDYQLKNTAFSSNYAEFGQVKRHQFSTRFVTCQGLLTHNTRVKVLQLLGHLELFE